MEIKINFDFTEINVAIMIKRKIQSIHARKQGQFISL